MIYWAALRSQIGVHFGDDVNAESAADYINFCVESIGPTRTLRCFPTKKPWITSDLKKLPNVKKKAFRGELLRTVRKQLKNNFTESKKVYRIKLESKLQQNIVSAVMCGQDEKDHRLFGENGLN